MSSLNDCAIGSIEDCLWIETAEAETIHAELLNAHGGLNGTRDESALESALMRAQQKVHYEDTLPLSVLAAAYCFAIATSHPFNDGNKRAAFTVANVFLLINGARIKAVQGEVVKTILLLAAGDLTEENLAVWISEHLEKK